MKITERIRNFLRQNETRMLRTQLTKMVVGYTPSFSTYSGGVYEMDMTVAAIDSFARHVSKASPKIQGSKYAYLEKQFQVYMNDTMTTSQFLYRLATIYKCENNAYVIPIRDNYNLICGWYPVSTIGSKITEVNGALMLTYKLAGKDYAIPYNEVIHMKSHHYRDELMGDGNSPLYSTMELIDTQNQGIINGVKQSATIRFLARLTQQLKPEDLKSERDRLVKNNLGSDNQGGVMIFDGKYDDIKQVDSKPFIVDAEQAEYIRKNVYNYFGTNEKILQNSYNETEWGAHYEGEIEPFLVQLSQGMTWRMFTDKERAHKNMILWESMRLQYADTATKLNLVTQLVDRGILSINQSLTIMNMPEREGGDKYYIRREYVEVNKLDADPLDDNLQQNPEEGSPDDQQGQTV